MAGTWDVIEGNWKILKGKVKEKWGKLTDDDIDVISGSKDQLVGKLQKQYGYAKQDAEREVQDFMRSCDSDCSTKESSKTM